MNKVDLRGVLEFVICNLKATVGFTWYYIQCGCVPAVLSTKAESYWILVEGNIYNSKYTVLMLWFYIICRWCLLRLLPLIIGDLVPKDNPYWINFLRLIELVDYLSAPETTLGYLRDLIQDHHSCFKELYPYQRITPKFHHLVHIPHYIIQ